MRNAWWVMLLAPVLLAGAGRAETLQQVLKAPHRQRVYDFAGVLSSSAEAKLRQRIHGMEQRHVAQGAVILVHRVEGATIESFANKVLNRWGVGERGRNNGFVLLAAIDQRKWRLATGTGLQKKIPNAEAAQLMKTAVVPAFRKKQYAAGLDAALVAIQQRASASTGGVAASSGTGTVPTSTPYVDATPAPTSGSGSGFPGWLIAMIAVPLVIVASLFGGRGRRGNTGWGGYGNSGFWGNNWISSSNNSSSSSNHSSNSNSTPDTSSSSSGSGDYGGGSSSGGGASGSW